MGEVDGLAEAYRAPMEDGDDDQGHAATPDETHYVVAPGKLGLLFIATWGIYGIYWFYKHWQHQARTGSPGIWPWARALFSVFFVTRLFKRLDWDTRSPGDAPTWNPKTQALVFIVVNVLGRVMNHLSRWGEWHRGLAGLALVVPLLGVLPLLTAQRVVNESVGDPHGVANSKLGAGGAVTLLLGVLVWGLMVSGLFARPG